jgi:DNA polymerase-3 subunit delta'
MAFEQVIGQQEAKARLMQLVGEGRLPHALMLCGPTGSGKMALAIGFAKTLLSRTPNDEAMLRQLEHPDLHFTYPTIKLPSMNTDHKPVSDDFAKEWHELVMRGPYFTMNEWLEQMGGENQQAIITAGESDDLTHKLSLKSSQGGYKVSLIWLPERMNIECANKMLKLIEEPPTQTLFILVCREPENLLETIRSRVQRFDVKPIATDDIQNALIQQRGLEQEDAHRVARISGGSWLNALEELKAGNENQQFFDYFVTLMRKAYMKDVKDLKRWSENAAALGREEQKRMLTYFLRMAREAFMYNFRKPELSYMTPDEEQFCTKFARFVNEGNILGFQELYQTAIRDIGQNANAKMVFFDITMRVAVLLHTT